MESQPQNPEFRNKTENFHPCIHGVLTYTHTQNMEGDEFRTVVPLCSCTCLFNTLHAG